jgi:hypothetical protein
MIRPFRTIAAKIRCDQLKNKSSRRVTYGNPCYSIGSKANSIYFLNDRSVLWSSLFDTSNVNQVLMSIYMTISNYSCQKYGTFSF